MSMNSVGYSRFRRNHKEAVRSAIDEAIDEHMQNIVDIDAELSMYSDLCIDLYEEDMWARIDRDERDRMFADDDRDGSNHGFDPTYDPYGY